MTKIFTCDRRRFLGAAVGTVAAAGRVMAESVDPGSGAGAQATPPRAGNGGASSFRGLKQIDAGVLNVGYAEDGPLKGPPSSSFTAGHTTSTPTWMSRRCWRPRGVV